MFAAEAGLTLRAADTVVLPRSGVPLTRLGMGCAPIGGRHRPVSDEVARDTIDAAWDLGLRYFDTAPYYGFTRAELRLGAALRDRPRAQYVVSTKAGRLMRLDSTVRPDACGWADPLPFRPQYDYSYEGIRRSHDDSVRRMCIDRIDVLLVHDIGLRTHRELHRYHWRQLTKGGGFRALRALREEGQVRAIGLGVSECEAVLAAMQECDLDCTVLAGRYTLLEQASLSPMLDACVRNGNAVIIGGPFNSGVLAGNDTFNYAEAPPEVFARVEAIVAVCRDFGVPLPAAALQFPMAHPAVVSCIPGVHDAAQLHQNAAWFELPIPPQLWQVLKQRGLLDERAPVDQGA
jgi:D-threo-aldose 1-dehydrogenase